MAINRDSPEKVMEVGGDVSNGLLSVETKSTQAGEREKEGEKAQYTFTHSWTHTSHLEAADTVPGLLHDLDVNGPMAIYGVID